MKEKIMMVVVLTMLSCLSGGVLASLEKNLKPNIENNKLKFVVGPAIKDLLTGTSNDPVTDRFKLTIDEKETNFFVGKVDGVPSMVAFELIGKGYGGNVGVLVGVNVKEKTIKGVRVTTHQETPGLGANAKDDPSFSAQFAGLELDKPVKVIPDGGGISAISGATITSRGVCTAVSMGLETYKQVEADIQKKLQEFE